MLLSDTLRWMQDELQKRFADQSSREAYAILLSLERFETMSQIIIGLDHIRLDDHEIALLKNWLKRRLDGEPLAYIRGYEYHYGRKFQVDKNVLIPRPETELITQRCLQIHGGSTTSNLKCLDIGTGSGILSVSLKLDLADSVWTATDISHECLKIAKRIVSYSMQTSNSFKVIVHAASKAHLISLSQTPHIFRLEIHCSKRS